MKSKLEIYTGNIFIMTDIVNSKRTNFKKDYKKDKDMARREVKSVYSRCLNTIKVSLPIQSVGNNLTQNLENYIKFMVEGKCIVEGFVKRDSVRIITNSSGLLLGDKVRFEVVYECLVCFPVSGMLLNCIAKNITKAGIRADDANESPSPFVLFVARDHFYADNKFSTLKENDTFIARVIGQRFEMNDKFISIIGEIVEIK